MSCPYFLKSAEKIATMLVRSPTRARILSNHAIGYVAPAELQLARSIIMLLIGPCNQICRWTPAVVAWLAETMRKPSRSDTCQRSVMNCFAHWLDLGCLYEEDVPMDMVAELTEAAFWLLPSTNDGKTWVFPDLHKCLLGVHEGPCIAGESLT